MKFTVEISTRAEKDLKKLDKKVAIRILAKIEVLENDMSGDVKRLTDFTPEYRLRVGEFRVLFDLEDTTIIVRRIKARREAYRI